MPSIPQCQMKECANSSFWAWVPGLPSFGFQAPREAQPSEVSGYATRAAQRYVDADVLVPVHPPFESTGLLCLQLAVCDASEVDCTLGCMVAKLSYVPPGPFSSSEH